MKLFSKTLAGIFGKEAEPEVKDDDTLITNLIVFNQAEKYEFAECGKCGAEIDPDWDYNCIRLQSGAPYPDSCPKCGCFFQKLVRAEEVK